MSARTRPSFASSCGQLTSEADELERAGYHVVEAGLDPHVRAVPDLGAKPIGEFLRTFLGNRTDRHVAPPALRRQAFPRQLLLELARLFPARELGHHAPVVLSLVASLP